MGCYAASAITAVTVQNTIGVQAVHPVPLEILSVQIDAVLSDIGAEDYEIGHGHGPVDHFFRLHSNKAGAANLEHST